MARQARPIATPRYSIVYIYTSRTHNRCVLTIYIYTDAVFDSLNGQDFASYLTKRGGTCGHYLVQTDCLDRRNVDKRALAIVHINGNGIKGQIDIAGMLDGSVIFRVRSLSGQRRYGNLTAAIHELPPLYGRKCDESTLGPVYDPTGAFLDDNYEYKCQLNKTECAVGDLRRRLGTSSRHPVFMHNYVKCL